MLLCGFVATFRLSDKVGLLHWALQNTGDPLDGKGMRQVQCIELGIIIDRGMVYELGTYSYITASITAFRRVKRCPENVCTRSC